MRTLVHTHVRPQVRPAPTPSRPPQCVVDFSGLFVHGPTHTHAPTVHYARTPMCIPVHTALRTLARLRCVLASAPPHPQTRASNNTHVSCIFTRLCIFSDSLVFFPYIFTTCIYIFEPKGICALNITCLCCVLTHSTHTCIVYMYTIHACLCMYVLLCSYIKRLYLLLLVISRSHNISLHCYLSVQ